MDVGVVVAVIAAGTSIAAAVITVANSVITDRQRHKGALELERLRFELQQAALDLAEERKAIETRERDAAAIADARRQDLVAIVATLQRFKDQLYAVCGTTRPDDSDVYIFSADQLNELVMKKNEVLSLYTSVSVRLIPYEVALLHDLKNLLIDYLSVVTGGEKRRPFSTNDGTAVNYVLAELTSAQEYFRVQMSDALSGPPLG